MGPGDSRDFGMLQRDLLVTAIVLAALLALLVAQAIISIAAGIAIPDAMTTVLPSIAAVAATLIAWGLARTGRQTYGVWMLAIIPIIASPVLAATIPSYLIFGPLVPIVGLTLIAPRIGLTALRRYAVVAWVAAVVAAITSGFIEGPHLQVTLIGWAAGIGTCDALAISFIVRAESRRRALLATEESTITELKAARETWQTLVESTPTPLWAYDPETLQFLLVNQAAVDAYGWTREDFLAGSQTMVVAPGQDLAFAQLFDRVDGDAPVRSQLRHLRKVGPPIVVQVEDRAILYGGRAARLQVVTDVTDLVHLKDERARLLDHSADFIVALDRTAQIREANHAFTLAVAGPAGNVVGAQITGFLRADDRGAFALVFTAALRESGTHESASAIQGASRAATPVSWRLVADASTELVWAFGRDVSRTRLLEEQLNRSERLRLVGQLAAGVAHDFNNLLTAIGGHAQLTLDELPKDSPVRPNLETIDEAVSRASTLTAQLLAFGRDAPAEFRLTSFDVVVDGVAPLLQRMIGEHIDLQIRHGLRVPILADAVGLDQVLLNLVVNARDAMPSGGTLSIETGAIVTMDLAGQSVEHGLLQVTDTGTGMSPHVLSRIFEPFFSTKSVGAGTGLGLASSEGILATAGGRIEVTSNVGVGSTFHVVIPRAAVTIAEVDAADAAAAEAEADAAPEADPTPPGHAAGAHLDAAPTLETGGSATILLVEDEESVRRPARRFLERAGYTVLEAADVPEADWIAAVTGTIDLLFTDIVMPGGSGRDLARRLVAARPDLRVILTSGYERPTADMTEIRGSAFLEKPWASRQMLDLVARMLGTPPTPSDPEPDRKS